MRCHISLVGWMAMLSEIVSIPRRFPVIEFGATIRTIIVCLNKESSSCMFGCSWLGAFTALEGQLLLQVAYILSQVGGARVQRES